MIKQHRDRFTYSARRLRRARRLYIFLCRKAWQKNPNRTMKIMSQKMRDNGLYAWTPIMNYREYRYRICRYMFRLLCKDTDIFAWSRWQTKWNLDGNLNQVKHEKTRKCV